jgi:hypothetical protein
VFVFEGQTEQLVVFFALNYVAVIVQLVYRPFKSEFDNQLNFLALNGLVVMGFFSLLLKLDSGSTRNSSAWWIVLGAFNLLGCAALGVNAYFMSRKILQLSPKIMAALCSSRSKQ